MDKFDFDSVQWRANFVSGGSGNALNCSLLRELGQPLDGLKGLGAGAEKKIIRVDRLLC